MKKLKYLILLFVAVLLLPVAVLAEEESTEASTSGDSKEVSVYFFRGEGCPHCQEAEEWFKSIEEEYGSLFNIVDYETWYNEDNANLMQQVAEARGEEAEGVPYIIIGDQSWSGFAEDYEGEILSKIQEVYAQDVDQRVDVMKNLDKKTAKEEKSSGSDVVALLIVLLVIGGIGFGIYKARSTTN